MTASTLREVEGFVEVKTVGAVQAKGVSRGVEAFELTATTPRGLAYRASPSPLTPLVGRRTEIEVFNRLAEQAVSRSRPDFGDGWRAGHGKIASCPRIYSPPAIGQIGLCWRLHRFLTGRLRLIFPWSNILRVLSESPIGMAVAIASRESREACFKMEDVLKDTTPPILSLLGALPDEQHSPTSGG